MFNKWIWANNTVPADLHLIGVTVLVKWHPFKRKTLPGFFPKLLCKTLILWLFFPKLSISCMQKYRWFKSTPFSDTVQMSSTQLNPKDARIFFFIIFPLLISNSGISKPYSDHTYPYPPFSYYSQLSLCAFKQIFVLILYPPFHYCELWWKCLTLYLAILWGIFAFFDMQLHFAATFDMVWSLTPGRLISFWMFLSHQSLSPFQMTSSFPSTIISLSKRLYFCKEKITHCLADSTSS